MVWRACGVHAMTTPRFQGSKRAYLPLETWRSHSQWPPERSTAPGVHSALYLPSLVPCRCMPGSSGMSCRLGSARTSRSRHGAEPQQRLASGRPLWTRCEKIGSGLKTAHLGMRLSPCDVHGHVLSGRPLGKRVWICISCGSPPNSGRAPCTEGNAKPLYGAMLGSPPAEKAIRTCMCTS